METRYRLIRGHTLRFSVGTAYVLFKVEIKHQSARVRELKCSGIESKRRLLFTHFSV